MESNIETENKKIEEYTMGMGRVNLRKMTHLANN